MIEANKARTTDLQAAREQLKLHRAAGWAALNTLFRSGSPPEFSLNGRFDGELIALDFAPGFTALANWIARMWMPWLGKTFSASSQRGDNIFTRDSYLLARIFNPSYRGFVEDGPETYRAFGFHTYLAPGLMDTDRQVLKIDYNLRENPALTVRRVLDELVQLDDNLYLGKAHLHWWGRWQTVAHFTLTSRAEKKRL